MSTLTAMLVAVAWGMVALGYAVAAWAGVRWVRTRRAPP